MYFAHVLQLFLSFGILKKGGGLYALDIENIKGVMIMIIRTNFEPTFKQLCCGNILYDFKRKSTWHNLLMLFSWNLYQLMISCWWHNRTFCFWWLFFCFPFIIIYEKKGGNYKGLILIFFSKNTFIAYVWYNIETRGIKDASIEFYLQKGCNYRKENNNLLLYVMKKGKLAIINTQYFW